MRRKSIALLLIFLSFSVVMTSLLPEIKAVGSSYTFSVDHALHNEYGLTYPVTYEFSIPSGSSGLAAYVRFSSSENWVRIAEKTSSNFFNGIQAVRFDYANKIAYVSVSFVSYSDSIYVYIADSSGNQINANYLGTAPYYDNRRVTVVFSVDDLGCDPPWGATDFSSCTAAFANAKVVWTGACETFGLGYYSDWPQVQAALNTGYFEADSHSRTHPMDVPYVPDSADPYCEGYVAEIGGSKADILGNLTLPYPYSNGGQGYVWGWIEPNGVIDNTVQQTLAQYGYLCSRETTQSRGTVPYPNWNPTFGIYDLTTTSVYMDGDTLQDLNSVFDSVYASGGIYHVWGHIGQNDWTPGGMGYQHIQHIAGKLDVWYVGYGAEYVYAYTRSNVQVNQAMSASISPTTARMDVGQSQTFTCSVSGGNAPYTYKWYVNGSLASGTAATWNFVPTQAGHFNIYSVATGSDSVAAQSNTVTDILVYAKPSVSISPGQVNMTLGGSQTFSSTVTGGLTPYVYQWRYSNGTAIAGATSSTLLYKANTTGTTNLYLNVTDNLGYITQSNTATINVYSQLSATINPTSVNMTVGGTQQFNSTVAGGLTPYSYQWYYSNGTAIAGSTSSTLMYKANITGTFNLYLNVTDSFNNRTQSNTATLNVYSQPTVTINPASVNMTLGGTQQFNSTVSGGLVPYAYQWYYTNGTAITGATTSSLTFKANATGTFNIYLNVTDNTGYKTQSNTATINVPSQPSTIISPNSVNMTVGSSNQFTSSTIGGLIPYSYQWYQNNSAISGATSANLMFDATSAGTYNIYLNVTDSNHITVKSNTATARVETPTNVTITPTHVEIYIGQSQTFNSTTSNGTTPYSYQWYLNDSAVSGATSQNWTFTPAVSGNYKVYLNVTDALNFLTQSNIVTDITVYPQLTVTISPSSVNMTVGKSQTFNCTISGGDSPYTYQWYMNGILVSGATNANWTCTPTTTGTYNIYSKVTDDFNATSQSNTAIITVTNPTSAAFDFGTSTSPVQSGYTQVTESTLYSTSVGYGWNKTTGLSSRDRGSPDNLTRDFVFSSAPSTFQVDLANGNYFITVTVGDQNYMHDNINIYAQNILAISNLTIPAGTFQQVSFIATITNGELNLTILKIGGTDPNWVINALTITVPTLPPTSGAFDFGTSTSPVQSGYTQVTESTLYSASMGYGWSNTAGLDSRDRGSPDNLTRDFVFSSTPHTFQVDLANGNYTITATIGDQNYMHDNITIYAQNVLVINNVTVSAGTFQQITFKTTISNGQLNLTIQDVGGGADSNWIINALTITPSSPPPTSGAFDFGTSTSPVQTGYTQVTESTLYSANLGYGWNSTAGLDSRDRASPDNLRRDFVFSSTDHTFNVDLANGNYNVTVIIGDQNYMHDQIYVYAQGTLEINNQTVTAGTFQQTTFTTTITNGQLNLRIRDGGGTDTNWIINALTITPSS